MSSLISVLIRSTVIDATSGGLDAPLVRSERVDALAAEPRLACFWHSSSSRNFFSLTSISERFDSRSLIVSESSNTVEPSADTITFAAQTSALTPSFKNRRRLGEQL